MPSLRRTSSSPNVRSSPYAALTRSSHHFRRSPSGSETSRRRVLADINWWTVMDGQSNNFPVYHHTTSMNDHNENHMFIPRTTEDDQQGLFAHPAADLMTRPSSPSDPSVNVSDARITLTSPFAQFAALSLAPRAVPLTVRRHTFPGLATTFTSITADSSVSSAGSSPDLTPVPLTPPPLQNPPFLLTFADDCTSDSHQLATSPPRMSLGSPFNRSSSWSGMCDHDHEYLTGSIFDHPPDFDLFHPLVEDDFH